ncbi:RNA-dependent RNA polymerase [Neurospora discreta fusarivirus 1]|uniref:RNA-dependent RNA polymerase n=1 Tax=Neurospora discreta fusarivirus 1 TaxID=2501219 RepID=A0A3T0D2F2_9VIRU|nr:RNA-dependent RNA polymerase [Neurospora discreta fusarivirus 1]AZT88657.1 RNA-dependent RNA polymerase [Neurospora discreta fusarivirus 1]BCL64192.1 RNA-dependent RNA polymerase [Neurospora discreta fusarivirus 1]
MYYGLLNFVLLLWEILFKIMLFITALCGGLLYLVVSTGLPVFLLFLCSFYTNPLVALWLTGWVGPLVLVTSLLLVHNFRSFILDEVALIKDLGPEHALWAQYEHQWWGKPVVRWVIAGVDIRVTNSDNDLVLQCVRRLLGTHMQLNYYTAASLLWSQCILWLEPLADAVPGWRVLTALWLVGKLIMHMRGQLTRVVQTGKFLIYAGTVILFTKTSSMLFALSVVTSICKMLTGVQSHLIIRRLKIEATIVATELLNLYLEYKFVGRKWYSREGFVIKQGTKFKMSLADKLSKLGIVIADMGLPNYILGSRKSSYSKSDLEESLALMKELGWPINTHLAEPKRFDTVDKYVDWLFCGTDWAQGLHQREMYLDKILDPLRVKATEWRRTEEYRTETNELESIARYFKSPSYDFPDLDLDDVWFLLKDVFEYSRLTPFNYIIKMWEKKYALGSFMRDPNNPRRKYSRWKFISSMGYKGFKRLWARTFEVASKLVPVSHISVKDEALPERKWAADKVRTVVGSPIGQYILSTIWNYWPNHNFRYESTPIKVGMPLNGFWFNRLFDSHSRCQVHYAGDFSEFDSTVSSTVLRIIAEVRKRGYDLHKDKDRIAKLIDINYDQVQLQLLNTTSNGNIYRKGTGLTTGHSSTSMDNSVATVVLYLMAWKQLTGLDARAFKHFNELSVFGDDHIISWLKTSPVVWNFENVQSTMAKWGVTLKVEASGELNKIPFLSKFGRHPTPMDAQELKAAGIAGKFKWVVYHDRERLIGKMVSKVKTTDPLYRLKRLLSYLSLTAHHRDVYTQLHAVITRSATFSRWVGKKGFEVPTYEKVLQDWYTSDAVVPHNEETEVAEKVGPENSVVHYGSVSTWDSILGAASMVPDLVNPVLFNFGYMRALQSRLCHLTSWPKLLIETSNNTWGPGESAALMRRTCYSFLDGSIYSAVDEPNVSTLLLRHWIFCVVKGYVPSWKATSQLNSLNKKVGDLQFLINGKVEDELRVWNNDVLLLLLVALLGFLHVPDHFNWLAKVEVPNVARMLDSLLGYTISNFWSSLPPNYADVVRAIRDAPLGRQTWTVSAPTGSGKSTALVQALANFVGHKYNKIIVIEPRSAIVQGTVPYMQQQWALDCTGSTSGMSFDPAAKVIYCTAQEFLLHSAWWSPDHLVVLDECHVQEPAYLLTQKVLHTRVGHLVLLSATPLPSQMSEGVYIPLNTARVWSLNTVVREFPDPVTYGEVFDNYRHNVLSTIRSLPKRSKMLVFVNTVKEALMLCRLIGDRAVLLSSNSKLPETTQSSIIVCTSVADVGVTLPDVDTVITMDVGFTIEENLEGAHPIHFRLGPESLQQRAGRTGRTNHGQAFIYSYTGFRVPTLEPRLQTQSSVLSLLKSGVSVKVLATHTRQPLLALMDLEGVEGDVKEDLIAHALFELEKYSENISVLLRERAEALSQPTASGEPPAVIDNARMGLLRVSTTLSNSLLLNNIITLCSALAKREFSSGERRLEAERIIFDMSATLQGNLRAREPFPDPDLGEWGFPRPS